MMRPSFSNRRRQPVVNVSRRTEIDDAPGSQGAKRENSGDYLSVEQRREPGAPNAASALGWGTGCSVD
jgi:hypothetical protein